MNASARPEFCKSNARGLRLWVPRLMLAAAVVHMMVGIIAAYSHWSGIISDGLWNTVRNDDDARMTALWFMISGVAFFGLGLLARRSVIATGTVPTETGWILLALGIPVAVLEPVSGGWSLIAIGVLAVVASRRDRSTTGFGRSAAQRTGGTAASAAASWNTAPSE
ncbi:MULTISPECIES: DUF6463 family protein [unclassified Streptomyces]|uniref:DUF6463 family protein n=1 Tax=unclassified Streptomyces TaxID=2593676 RepID=UPI000362C192|nr:MULTISPECIES: DUF6463 family protein [unclassified Streptomyces]MYT27376.1 hypothetical protein [Streptomyces sp. SID8354]